MQSNGYPLLLHIYKGDYATFHCAEDLTYSSGNSHTCETLQLSRSSFGVIPRSPFHITLDINKVSRVDYSFKITLIQCLICNVLKLTTLHRSYIIYRSCIYLLILVLELSNQINKLVPGNRPVIVFLNLTDTTPAGQLPQYGYSMFGQHAGDEIVDSDDDDYATIDRPTANNELLDAYLGEVR